MRLIKKKGEVAVNEITYVVLAIVLLAVGLSIFLIFKSNFLNEASARETLCYFSNNVKSGGAAFSFFPSLCSLEIIPEGDEVGKEEFASLLRRSWWMYLQGAEDFGNIGDEVFPVYQFTPTEDILLKDYFEYSLETSNGNPSTLAKSNYAYLEKNGKDNALCFDSSGDDNSIQNYYLKKGETYYIIFYDNQMPHDEDWGDKLLISSNPEFDANLWKATLSVGITTAVLSAGGILPAIATASGASVGIYYVGDAQNSACLVYYLYGNVEGEA